MPNKPPRPVNLAELLKAEQQKIDAAQQRIRKLHSREGERLVRLAAKCGLLDVQVSDADLEKAFRELATKKHSAQVVPGA